MIGSSYRAACFRVSTIWKSACWLGAPRNSSSAVSRSLASQTKRWVAGRLDQYGQMLQIVHPDHVDRVYAHYCEAIAAGVFALAFMLRIDARLTGIAHLRSGGRFVIENGVPALQSLPSGMSWRWRPPAWLSRSSERPSCSCEFHPARSGTLCCWP